MEISPRGIVTDGNQLHFARQQPALLQPAADPSTGAIRASLRAGLGRVCARRSPGVPPEKLGAAGRPDPVFDTVYREPPQSREDETGGDGHGGRRVRNIYIYIYIPSSLYIPFPVGREPWRAC